MDIQSDIIIYFIKLFVVSLYSYYIFKKISSIKNEGLKQLFCIFGSSLILAGICTYINFFINPFLSIIILCLSQGIILSIITKKKIGYSIILTCICYAVCVICQVASVIIVFIPYRLLYIHNNYINLIIILIIQFIFIYLILKIKRFIQGFNFVHEKLDNEFADIVMINISTTVIIVTSLIGTITKGIQKSRINLLISFFLLTVIMVITIQKTLTMYYKQKLLKNTLHDYEEEIREKDKEIEKIKNEKFKISKITHEFYNRQKALELAVNENMKNTKNKEQIKIINKIKNLTEEYSEELTKITTLPQIPTTNISEIDDMLKYMQSECSKNNIEFKVKIIGNIYPLINNIIQKNKLETLIGDHLRDAINAVNIETVKNKEILIILGIKDNKYEVSFFDTGVEFKIDTLLKLGLEATTTNKAIGGSGIGFLTTFETMKQTGASLIIKEFQPEKAYYTKSITIRFDNKNQYKICSYRFDEIKKYKKQKRILIEKI